MQGRCAILKLQAKTDLINQHQSSLFSRSSSRQLPHAGVFVILTTRCLTLLWLSIVLRTKLGCWQTAFKNSVLYSGTKIWRTAKNLFWGNNLRPCTQKMMLLGYSFEDLNLSEAPICSVMFYRFQSYFIFAFPQVRQTFVNATNLTINKRRQGDDLANQKTYLNYPTLYRLAVSHAWISRSLYFPLIIALRISVLWCSLSALRISWQITSTNMQL